VVTAHATGGGDMLGVWPAVVVGLLYAAIFCGAGFLVVSRSDAPTSGD
jgi:ABC-type multidrug transport system permease subunit